MASPQQIIKIINLALGGTTTLASLSQLTYIFSRFNVFLLGVYSLLLSIPIVYLEFKVPPNLHRFVSSYFSFLGRAAIFFLLSGMTAFGGAFKIINSLLLFFAGCAFVFIHVSAIIDEPDNFKGQGASISIGDDLDDEDDVI